jgi:hypothetical protein
MDHIIIQDNVSDEARRVQTQRKRVKHDDDDVDEQFPEAPVTAEDFRKLKNAYYALIEKDKRKSEEIQALKNERSVKDAERDDAIRAASDSRLDIAKLQMTLFWKDNTNSKLTEFLCSANAKTTECDCEHCVMRWEYAHNIRSGSSPCIFGTWLDAQMIEHGLVCIRKPDPASACINVVIGALHVHENLCYDDDCHFVEMPCEDYGIGITPGRWAHFGIGAKLWKATSLNDPEIVKFQNLKTKIMSMPNKNLPDDYDDAKEFQHAINETKRVLALFGKPLL